MRALVALALLALAACPGKSTNAGALDDDDGVGGGARECDRDDQCAAAAAKCCDCPTFAVPQSDPRYGACNGVSCPGTTCTDNVAAACIEGGCTLVCKPMVCEQTCALGFATDASGCLTCACAEPAADACHANADCVEVRADCCGCTHGGVDTAVLVGEAAAHDQQLGCPSEPQCPSVNTCDAAAEPMCVTGRCELISGGMLPPNACGRADLPACPGGQVCLVNADKAADQLGVGVCASP